MTHTAPIAADTWIHVSGLYDGLSVAVEIDGATRSTACRTGPIVPSPGGVLTLGGKFNGAVWSEVFRGNLDEVRIRSSANFTVGRVSGACAVGEAVTSVTLNGAVTCGASAPQRVIRFNVFDTVIDSCCWVADNNPSLFGGVNPSTWTDSNGMASNMSASAETLRTLFNKKLFPGANAMVSAARWRDNSSTNGKVTVALLRINNSTGGAIDWQPFFYFTAFASWGERASIAVNGVNAWNTGGDHHHNSTAAPTLSIPANQTSTVIWVVPSGPPWSLGVFYRMTFLAFYNDSLTLPQGLTLVDDLDTLNGNVW